MGFFCGLKMRLSSAEKCVAMQIKMKALGRFKLQWKGPPALLPVTYVQFRTPRSTYCTGISFVLFRITIIARLEHSTTCRCPSPFLSRFKRIIICVLQKALHCAFGQNSTRPWRQTSTIGFGLKSDRTLFKKCLFCL